MKRLQEETMTKMAVLGRGSMRDKQKKLHEYNQADLGAEMEALLATGNPSNMWMFIVKDLSG
jgi:hypothetical protein